MDAIEKQIYYTNSVSVGLSFTDIIMKIGINIDNSVTSEAIIFMSPQHAKLLNQVLNETLITYEKQFGEIKIPPKPEVIDKEIK